MDEIYRGYRIALTEDAHWSARVSHVRGPVAPITVRASIDEGPQVCIERARARIDQYLTFLEARKDA